MNDGRLTFKDEVAVSKYTYRDYMQYATNLEPRDFVRIHQEDLLKLILRDDHESYRKARRVDPNS